MASPIAIIVAGIDMKNRQIDKRCIKTKHKINKGLQWLVRKKSMLAIRASDIYHAARISPASFYRRYHNVNEYFLIEENDLLENFAKFLEKNSGESSRHFYLNFLLFIYEHRDFIMIIIDSESFKVFHRMMLSAREEILKRWNDYGARRETIFNFYVMCVLEDVILWRFEQFRFSSLERHALDLMRIEKRAPSDFIYYAR